MCNQDQLTRFYEMLKIPLCLADRNSEILLTAPNIDGSFLSDEVIQLCIKDFSLQKKNEEQPLVFMIEIGFFVGIAKLDESHYLLLGPVAPVQHSDNDVMKFCQSMIYQEKITELYPIIRSTPVVSYRQYINTLSVAIQFLTGREITIDKIALCNNDIQSQEQEKSLIQQVFTQREDQILHTPESYERGILAAIETGDLEILKRRLIEAVTGTIGVMSKNPVTQEKYTFISFVTMVTRAAIRGGLDSEAAYNLSDIYCQQMDELLRVQDITALTYEMALEFCNQVSRNMGKIYSLPVRICQKYISIHLHEQIRMSNLSDACGFCAKTITKKFQNETGLSAIEYINAERLKEAKHLLMYTNYSISDIGNYLQYISQSYFTKCFSDKYGITPQQYRNGIKTMK